MKFGRTYLEPSKDYIITVESHDGSMIPVRYDTNVKYLQDYQHVLYGESAFDAQCAAYAGLFRLHQYVDVTSEVSEVHDFRPYNLKSTVDNWESLPVTSRLRILAKCVYSPNADAKCWTLPFHQAVLDVAFGNGYSHLILGYISFGLLSLVVKVEVFGVKPNIVLDAWAKITGTPRTPKWYVHECDIKPHMVLKSIRQLIINRLSK